MGILFGLTIHLLRAKSKMCDPNESRDGDIIMRRYRSSGSLSFRKRLKVLQKEQSSRRPMSPLTPMSSVDGTEHFFRQQSSCSSDTTVQGEQVKPLFYKDTDQSDSSSSTRSESPTSHPLSSSESTVVDHTPSSDYRIHFDSLRQESIPEDELYETSTSRIVTRSISAETQDRVLTNQKLSDMNDNETVQSGVPKTFSAPSRLHDLVKKHHGLSSVRSSSSFMSKKDSLRQKQVKSTVRTEQKASKTLGILFGCFVFCWGPFFIVNILTAICESCSFDHLMVTIFMWLGYVSSTLNPVIYTVFNRTFKTTIIKLMKCQYKRVQKSMRIKAICVGLNYNVPDRKKADMQIPL
jgi:hypothetical protein